METKLKLLKDTLQNEYSMPRFVCFVKEFFTKASIVKPDKKHESTFLEYDYIISHAHVADYTDSDQKKIAVIAVAVKNRENIEVARSTYRNFIARFILARQYDGAIVAFYNKNEPRWRLSLVRLECADGKNIVSLAKCYSYLAGRGEPCYTAIKQLYPVFSKADYNPTLERIQEGFSIESVNKDFFDIYCAKYFELKKEIINNCSTNKTAVKSQSTTGQFAMNLMGQILFLYFLQKKGLLSVRSMFEHGPKSPDKKLFKHYFKLLWPANGNVFMRQVDAIIDLFDRYNFTLKEDEPFEREVAVNPAMLGKIFENLIGVKERKSKGVFYTPPEIVNYMCQQSLIHYLVSKTGIKDDDVKEFILYGVMKENNSSYEYLMKIDDALACIKVADPAVGSGAFPLGMLSEIVKARNAITVYLAQQETDSLERRKLLEATRVPYKIRKNTIKNGIFGVDIEAGAVNICKWRLWLAAISDQEIDNIDFNLHRKLDNNILCGNSLVDDFEIFKENGDFDIIIGNPPYIDSEGMMLNGMGIVRDIIARNYSMATGNWDIYIPFFELGFRLLSPNGTLIYITPDKWISKSFGDELRRQLMPHLDSVLKVGRKVFQSANVDAIVSQFNKSIVLDIKVYSYINGSIRYQRKVSKDRLTLPFTLDIVFSESLDIVAKIEKESLALGLFFSCENACATSDAYKLKEIVKEVGGKDDFDSDKHLKIINTGTIDKYLSKWGIKKMTYLKDEYLYPIAKKDEFFDRFKKTYALKAIRPKIIIKGLTLLDACLDDTGTVIPGKSTMLIADEDINNLKYLLAIINSKIVKFYIKEKYSSSTYNGGVTFTKRMINNLPIKQITAEQKEAIIKLVDTIIFNKSQYHDYDVAEYENAINSAIYSWHNLTEAEIRIIEGHYKENPTAI